MEKEIGWLLQEKYNGRITTAAKKDIERLKAGEPLDHIIGFVEFLGCKILVDKNVLIPRFETEVWVEEAIREIRKPFDFAQGKISRKLEILDMFAGSGAIGIAVLKHLKNSHVVFVDSEKGAIAQIKKNGQLNKIPAGRYEVIQSDVFEQLQGPTSQCFDYIFANPPYIPNTQSTIHNIQKSVIDYEPHAALFGGRDGMDLIRRFLAAAKNRLNPSTSSGRAGKISMEFDTPQKPLIAVLLKKLKYRKWDFHRDQYGKWRWVVVQ